MKTQYVLAAALAASLLAAPLAMGQRAYGIDVSHYDGNVYWTTVAQAGYTFAWTKATEGVGNADAYFAGNENSGKAAGFLVGAYHFAHPELDDPISEANYFWSVAGPYIIADGKSLMPTLDMETFTGLKGASSYSDWADQWCAQVVALAAANGVTVKPVVYTTIKEACSLDGSMSQWDAWIAQPTSGGNPASGSPWWNGGCEEWGTGVWQVWQYGGGVVAGVSGNGGVADLDVYNGTIDQMAVTMTATPTGGTEPPVSSVVGTNGANYIYAMGTDGALWTRWQTSAGGNWTSWTSLGGADITSVQVLMETNGQQVAFVQVRDGSLWTAWQTDIANNVWSGWAALGGNASTFQAVLEPNGAAAIYAISGTGIYTTWQTNYGSAWAPWTFMNGTGFNAVHMVVFPNGATTGFFLAYNGNIWTISQQQYGGSWSGFIELPTISGGIVNFEPVLYTNNIMALYGVAASGGGIVTSWQAAPGGSWAGWASLGGNANNNIHAIRTGDGGTALFAMGKPQSDVWWTSQVGFGGAWQTWQNLGGPMYDVKPTLNLDGAMALYGVAGNDVWTTWQSTVYGSWSTWLDFGTGLIP